MHLGLSARQTTKAVRVGVIRRIVSLCARGRTLVILCAGLVVVSCGSNDGTSGQSNAAAVRSALMNHIEAIQETDQDLIAAGPLTALKCEELGETFRDAPVLHCSADHGDGRLVADWCAALVDGRLYTQADNGMPCLESSVPLDPTETERK
jgi:hypothetical protein